MGVHLKGMYLMSVYVTSVHVMSMCLMGLHLTGRHLMGVHPHLLGMHFIGKYVIGVHVPVTLAPWARHMSWQCGLGTQVVFLYLATPSSFFLLYICCSGLMTPL